MLVVSFTLTAFVLHGLVNGLDQDDLVFQDHLIKLERAYNKSREYVLSLPKVKKSDLDLEEVLGPVLNLGLPPEVRGSTTATTSPVDLMTTVTTTTSSIQVHYNPCFSLHWVNLSLF